jgi:hypothetical protein
MQDLFVDAKLGESLLLGKQADDLSDMMLDIYCGLFASRAFPSNSAISAPPFVP